MKIGHPEHLLREMKWDKKNVWFGFAEFLLSSHQYSTFLWNGDAHARDIHQMNESIILCSLLVSLCDTIIHFIVNQNSEYFVYIDVSGVRTTTLPACYSRNIETPNSYFGLKLPW